MTTIYGDVIISGRYILERRLGNGGMGIVFKAKHKFLKSLFAIKIILPSLVEQDKNLLTRFKQEAVLAASIDHPNVVRVTDFGVEDEMMPYLVMEYVDGTPLSDFLHSDKPLSLKETLEFFQPIARGVAEAHRQGIVHRDLKPQNIMVQKNMPLKKGVKVLDFGLAKIKSTESFGSFVQTQSNNILGSPPYMSPEQWENDNVDHRADIYGLGVILYQMLTGNLPFQADSIPSVMYQHLTVEMPAFATHRVSLAPEIENVVRWALQKDREKRPATVEDMLAAFEQAVLTTGLTDFTLSTITPFTSPSENQKTIEYSDKIQGATLQLTDSQREKLSAYFDSSAQVGLLGNEKLAQEFLKAQNRAEEAKAQANQADRLVQELAEAQKDAEEAQNKALAAKQKIEDEVRQQLEAEMENKLALEQQARQKAEAERLAQEIEARKRAEERANYLAQAALEAQKIAELERKKNEAEAHQREMHESVRREFENEALQLAKQVAEAKEQFEKARQQSEYEARLRQQAEEKRIKIEQDLQFLAEQEAERRKVIAEQAQKQIEEQANRFEKEAAEAQKRIEEARMLAEFEQQKREQAESLQKNAEAQARRFADEIIKVQKRMEEIEKSIEPHSQSTRLSSPDLGFSAPASSSDQLTMRLINLSDKSIDTLSQPADFPRSTIEIQTATPSNPTYSGFLNTNPPQTRRSPLPMIAGGIALLLLAVLTGFGLFVYFRPSPDTKPPVANNTVNGTTSSPKQEPAKKNELILISGGDFQMGRNDVTDKNDRVWGNQFPAHSVNVSTFLMSKTEISHEEYAEFVQDAKYQTPVNWVDGKPPKGKEKFPIVNVSLTDAKTYVEWFSKRENKQCSIPTEDQWEYAARNGAQQTSYPWGNDWGENAANITTGGAKEVGTSEDETSKGIKDMMGNVFEWTTSKYVLYSGEVQGDLYIVRGSYFAETQNNLEKKSWFTTRRTPVPIDQKSHSLGFRIVCQP